MNDERLSREIQAALTAREPGPVPASLRARIASVPVMPASRRWPGPVVILRDGMRLAAVAAAVALVAAIADYGLDRTSSATGGPPDQAAERVPFVIDGAGLFRPGPLDDADRRLGNVFRATGLEATLVTQREPAANQLSTPAGFPERYDRDGNHARDIVQAVAIDPNGTVSCCLSITGPIVDQADGDGYWLPLAKVGSLTAAFASSDPAEREAALDSFVTGVERLSGKVDEVAESIRTTEALRTGTLGGLTGAIALVSWWFVRRRQSAQRQAARGDAETRDTVFEDLAVGGSAAMMGASTTVESVVTPEPGAVQSPVDWEIDDRAGRRGRRRLGREELLLAVGATVGVGVYLFLGLVVGPTHLSSRAVDPAASGFGVAAGGPPVIAIASLVAAAVLIMVLATRIGRAGWVLLCLSVVAALAIGLVVVNEQPGRGTGSASGLGFDHRESAGIQGTTSFDVYPVGKGDAFSFAITVRNPGPLPITILGLPGTFTKPGPGYVPGLEIVGLGSRTGSTISGSLAGADVFQPVRLGEGEEVQLVVVGRGGTCAAGSLHAPESIATITHLPLAYTVLGVSRVIEVDLPSVVAVPTVVATCES